MDFIARNYAADARGCWNFQNGPQRVFVELQATPQVWRLQPNGSVQDHTARSATVQSCWLDEAGHLYLQTNLGFGLVHSQDVHLAADQVEQGQWHPQDCSQANIAAQFGFVKSPQLLQSI
jgi:hypothetical protein